MADGLLGLLGGGGNTGGMDLNQLVRPPDPLGDALAAMSERFAQAGQASRLPTSTLGALGSALGGASTAARAAQGQYLDQAIKVQALKRSLMAMGYDEKFAEILAQERARQLARAGQGGTGAPPAVTPPPAIAPPQIRGPLATPAAAPAGAPGAPFALPQVGDYSGVLDPSASGAPRMPGLPTASPGAPPAIPGAEPLGVPTDLPIGTPGTTVIDGINRKLTPALGGPGPLKTTGLLGDQGGPGAGVMPASFRPADLVAPDGRAGNGAGDAGTGLDLRGLLALASKGGAADPFAGLLATDAPIQAGGPDTLVKSGDQSQLPIERASLAVPSKDDPRGMIPFIRERAQKYGVNPDTAVAVARSEGLGSFYGDGGKSGTAFQLYTGGGLGNEFQKQTGLDPLDPKNEQAAIDWALANVNRTGWSPYHGAKTVGVSDRTGLPGGDSGEGGGGRPNVQLAQYAPGGGAPAAAAPSAASGPLGMPPETIALLNAYATLAGRGAPFKEFLDVYYKSPEYLQEAARVGQLGKSMVDLQFLPLISGLQEIAKAPGMKIQAEDKAAIDRVTAFLAERAKAGFAETTITINTPNGPVKVPATGLQKSEALGGPQQGPAGTPALPPTQPPPYMGPQPYSGTAGAPAAAAPAAGAPAAGPGAPAAGAPGSVYAEPVYTPEQLKTQELRATDAAKLVQGYREAADTATSTKTTLQNIAGEIGKIVHGPFADTAQQLATYWNTVDPRFSGQVKSYEEFNSNVNELVRKAVKASDPNPAFAQIRIAMDSLPIPEKSEAGLWKMTNRMIGFQNSEIAKGNAVPVYEQTVGRGSPAGFDSWWRTNVSPYSFIFAQMSPEDRGAVVTKLRQTPQGQRELDAIGKQLKFIEMYGGFGVK